MHAFLRRAVRWGIIAMVLAVVYVLSVGPVIYFLGPGGENGRAFFVTFYAPLIWLHENTPLRDGLESYAKWWDNLR
jgi:hypothetical protein